MNLYRNRFVSHLVWRFVLRNPKFRRRLQRLLFQTGEIEVDLFGQPLIIDSQEEIGYLRAARAQSAAVLIRDEIPQLVTVMSLLGPRTTFVDAGANVGFWSTTAASLSVTVPGLRVLAFEANPDTFARLQRNLARFEHASAVCTALSDKAGELTFYRGATSGVFGAAKRDFNTDETVTIAARPLDPFLATASDLIVKIDVEGHELPVLRGMRQAISSGRVRAVFIDGYQKTDEAEILDLLAGFTLLNAKTRGPFDGNLDHVPLLAVKSNQTLSPA